MLFSIVALLVLLALLAGQVRSTSGRAAARQVRLLRRVYETTVVETLVGASGPGNSVTRSVSSSGSRSALPSAPTTRAS